MDILTIHHLCYYLEEIGIIDQTSLPPFLSLYSFVLNKNKENGNRSKKHQNIFENVLCAYLKKIFSVEKNYKIFSNKIITKFQQHFILKQYNGIILLFTILRKNLNSSKIQSYYTVLKKLNNPKTNSSFQDDSPFNENKYISNKHKKKKSFDSFRFQYMKKSKIKDDSNYNRSDIFNKSVDFIKYRPRNTSQSLNNKNRSQQVNLKGKNIQLEFKKKQFLSKIKREHAVKFKRSNSQKMIKNNNNMSAARDNKSVIFRDFSTSRISNTIINKKNRNRKNNNYMNSNLRREYTMNPNDFHYYNLINDHYNNNNNYDDDDNYYENEKEEIPTQSNYSNNINLTTFYNNFDNEVKKDYVPNSVKGGFSFKSKYGNLNSFNYPIAPNNKMNTISNYKMSGNNYMGHIIKKDFNNSLKIQNKPNILSPKDIYRIKEKLEKLNYFNYNS